MLHCAHQVKLRVLTWRCLPQREAVVLAAAVRNALGRAPVGVVGANGARQATRVRCASLPVGADEHAVRADLGPECTRRTLPAGELVSCNICIGSVRAWRAARTTVVPHTVLAVIAVVVCTHAHTIRGRNAAAHRDKMPSSIVPRSARNVVGVIQTHELKHEGQLASSAFRIRQRGSVVLVLGEQRSDGDVVRNITWLSSVPSVAALSSQFQLFVQLIPSWYLSSIDLIITTCSAWKFAGENDKMARSGPASFGLSDVMENSTVSVGFVIRRTVILA